MSTAEMIAGGTGYIASAGTNSTNPAVKAFLASLHMDSPTLDVSNNLDTKLQNIGSIVRSSGVQLS